MTAHTLESLIASDLGCGHEVQAAKRVVQWLAQGLIGPGEAQLMIPVAIPVFPEAVLEAAFGEIGMTYGGLVNMSRGRPGVRAAREKRAKYRHACWVLGLIVSNRRPAA